MKERGAKHAKEVVLVQTVCFTHHLQHQDVNPFTDITGLAGLEKVKPLALARLSKFPDPWWRG